MQPSIELAPGAQDNGLAVMLSDLVRQNLASKPHKQADFDALARLSGSIAIVADDADVALTLRFEDGKLRIHDGIVGIPDITIRGDSDTILALSNMPLTRRMALPLPSDKEGLMLLRSVVQALRGGRFHIYGGLFNLKLLTKLGRVMSVNG